MSRLAGTLRSYSGTTIKEAMREVLIEAEMPLQLKDLAARVGEVRKQRLLAKKPTAPGSIDRAASEHRDVFFKLGPFVALREWDQPSDFARFIQHYRTRRRA